MGLNACGRRFKVTGLLVHSLLLAGGITIIAMGSWVGSTGSRVESVMGSKVYHCGYILMAMGVLVFVFNITGCLATQTENKCLSLVYIVTALLTFVVIVIGIALTFVFRDQLTDSAHNSMMASISQDYEENPDIQLSWDTIQQQLRCCGVANGNGTPPYEAWKESRMFMSTDTPPFVPVSCCLRTPGGDFIDRTDCLNTLPSNLTVYGRDCQEAAVELIRGNALLLAGVCLGISCLLVLSIIVSCSLFNLIE